ncbi:pre-toxin TG domain-containing protein [Pseudogulbenkiania subflava]|uniref:Pre-toxin TG n=1 Tax=Pseudogulbenkiania subflava DSM 22618 TaxID=1123014 RepID=A0A1Y6BPW8_9NEIS|nr:pre-toxin TG domain-containing protein [Pseudogulbenkiania subflava]SMF13835.1 Pre-toxin TG [Pseudogulbenkiania subflava DSM 22618]
MSIDPLRRLLLSTPVLGVAGCATPGNGTLGKLLGPKLEYDSGRAMTPEEARQAELAAAIFDQFLKKKTLAGGLDPAVTPTSLRLAVANWNRAFSVAQRQETLTLSEFAALSQAFVPLFRQLDAASALVEAGGKRLITPTPGAFGIRKGVLTLPAGGACQFTEQGYCLDPCIPAPIAGERFRLVPLDRLLPSELYPLYRDMLVASKTDRALRADLQALLWLLRTVGDKTVNVGLTDRTRQLLNKVRPTGALEFELARNKEALLAPLRDIASLVDDLSGAGQGFDLNQLHDVASAQQAVADLMQRMITMKADTPIPNDLSHFSLPAPGVAVMCLGSGILKPTVSIVNTNDRSIDLDLTKHVAVSTRRVQRVALTLPDKLNGSQFPIDKGGNTDALARLLPNIAQGLEKDLGWFAGQKVRDNFPSLLEKTSALWRRHPRVPELLPAIPEKLGKFRAFLSGRGKTVVEAVPFVGNFLSVYELYTGTNWWTGEPLTPAERILAALGTVPGVGQMERLAGQSSIDLVKWALNSAKGRYVLKAADLRSTLNDINDFLTGATANAIGLTVVSDTEKRAMSALDDAIRTGLTSLRAT